MSHDEPSPGDAAPERGTAADSIWDRLRALEEAPRADVSATDSSTDGPIDAVARSERPQPQPQPRSPFAADSGRREFPPTQVAPVGEPHGQGTLGAGPGQYFVPAAGANANPAGVGGSAQPRRTAAPQSSAPQRPAAPGVPASGHRPPASAAAAGAAYQQHGVAGGGPGGTSGGGPGGGGGPAGRGPAGRDPQPPQPRPAVKKVRKRKAWYRPKLRWFVLYLPLLIMAMIAGLGVWGWMTVKDLGRVDVGDSLVAAEGDAVNYLIVGSDTREGADQEAPDAGVIGDSNTVGGKRSDTIIVLRVEPERSLMMSIPRDLWATNVATGKQGRINGTFNQGPDNLIRSVTANLGIPINHYVEVDFVSFAAMVDAMGGITMEFPYPAYDPKSGLRVISDGPVVLDGTNALAYVRSRTYTEIREDGSEVVEPTGDLGRQQRQQDFIRTVLRTAGNERNPLTLARVASGAAKGVRVDQEIGFGDLLSLARRLGGGEPESRVLPTKNAKKGEASVLELIDAEALPILLEFGAG